MPTYYFHVEAVNFDTSVYDTNDISTIRGGSFVLLDIMNQLSNMFNLTDVGSAASVGLYKFQAKNDTDAENLVKETIDFLTKTAGNFSTFTYSFMSEGNLSNYKEIIQTLSTRSRWRQYQQLSLVLPGIENKGFECQLDGVRPATEVMSLENKELFISDAVFTRREKGKVLRNKLYEYLLGVGKYKYTNDLESLSSRPYHQNLDGKIAFINIDGNRFGQIREKMCTTETELIEFQRYIQNIRTNALNNILKKITAEDQKPNRTVEGEIRIETLLWGGDEIELIVPAWDGIEILKTLFEVSKDLHYRNQYITHSAGIVFCHHNTPILQVRRMAKQLCNLVKTTLPIRINDFDNNANRFAFVSLDQVSTTIQELLISTHLSAEPRDFVIPASELNMIIENMVMIKQILPKGKLHEIIAILMRNADKEILDKVLNKFIKQLNHTQRIFIQTALDQILGKNYMRWFLIADLWPYIGEKS